MNDGKGDVWVEAGFTELARSGGRGCQGRGARQESRRHQGRLLPPLRRPCHAARCHAGTLARGTRGVDRAADKPRWTRAPRAAEGGDPALFRAAQSGGYGDRARDPAMGPLGRKRRHGSRERGRGAAQARRRALSRDRPRGRGGRGAGLPFLLLHLRPELAVRRARSAQTLAARGEVGREAAWA